jgi:hypothetical protein
VEVSCYFVSVIVPHDSAAFWTMVQAVAVVLTLVYALVQYRAYISVERLKNTFPLLAGFGDSNEAKKAFEHLLYAQRPVTPDAAWFTDFVSAFVSLQNYLDAIDDLYERHAIDRDFTMSRQYKVIEESVVQMERWYDLIPPRHVNKPMWKRLKARVDDYKRQHGIMDSPD